MLRANNEAKVRRSTKSTVLGKAKVMSFKDLVEARTKRLEKDAAKDKRKAKSGEKRNATALGSALEEPVAKVGRLGELGQSSTAAQQLQMGSETIGVRAYVAPAAKMW